MTTTEAMQQARTDAVREQAMKGVAAVLEAGRPLTFREVAGESGVPERTLYRYFPTREHLLAAVFEWANRRIGFDGSLPKDEDDVVSLVRRVFPGFDGLAPVIRELLVAPEGLSVRVADSARRRRAATALVRHEVPHLDRISNRRVAATVQLLTTAGAWQTLRDYWGMDGDEAAETCALAIQLLLEGARGRAQPPPVT